MVRIGAQDLPLRVVADANNSLEFCFGNKRFADALRVILGERFALAQFFQAAAAAAD